MELKTLLDMHYQHVQTHPDKLFLQQPKGDKLETYTWAEFDAVVRRVASGLQAMDLPKGSHIALLSKNCAEWFIADLAIMMAGHVSIPIFPTAGESTIQYVLKHAQCPVVFVGKLDDPEPQLAAIPDDIKTIGFPYPGCDTQISWEQMCQNPAVEGEFRPALDDIMTIIYTSGSTGSPKGVVHTYGSICWAAQSSLKALTVNGDDRIVSYLPLAHITERVLVEAAAYFSGMQISFIESLDTFTRDVKQAQPTLFISVPRLWTRFQMGILAKMPQKKLNFLLAIPFVGKAVARKIRQQLGLDKARLWASGSAPISPATIEWFHRIGINISEGWGMTENSAYGTGSVPFRVDKIGSIGRPYEGVDIRISDEGEIQVKAPCNMKEYYLEPEKTAEVFTDDGYLRTGDKGEIDAEGYVRITGRLKDIFKTAKGKYVTPVPIEAKIMENAIIEQVCVTGSNLKQPIALLVLAEETRNKAKDELHQSLQNTLTAVNDSLESHQVLDHFIVMSEPWTIENDLLTPTLKVKRHILEDRFADVINQKHDQPVVWLTASS
ncbi:AMP-binding protein [Aestuariibacter halophilus]|uniref:AMP-binding protein n=1 Tax=Fluctibacter halophilus TaxID=226011 RepID=A0ABS8GBX6_9ALTE|nr:AMP-binding protein [Aestuariibacter halophilus]MCC2617259.1 AMP-binding protein [Aestuariibacter halophilus]